MSARLADRQIAGFRAWHKSWRSGADPLHVKRIEEIRSTAEKPGDIFGVENGAVHRFTAEAIVETTVRLTHRHYVIEGGRTTATNNVLRLVTNNLQHAETHMLLLGRKTSIEKVAAFLIEMDIRLTAAEILSLPMNRRDIADYLGLTLETVSRALSQLKDRDVITFIGHTQRQIVLRDRQNWPSSIIDWSAVGQ